MVLPPGIHLAAISEVEQAFATNPHRRKLFFGLVNVAKALSIAGSKYLYLDGSYVTTKPRPSDFDGCWCTDGADPNSLDPVLLDFDNDRRNQKLKYGGEVFPLSWQAEPGTVFLDFFQVEKFSGNPKGIIAIDLTKESFKHIEGGSA